MVQYAHMPARTRIVGIRAAIGPVVVGDAGIVNALDHPARLVGGGVADDDDLEPLVSLGLNRGDRPFGEQPVVVVGGNDDGDQRFWLGERKLVIGRGTELRQTLALLGLAVMEGEQNLADASSLIPIGCGAAANGLVEI